MLSLSPPAALCAFYDYGRDMRPRVGSVVDSRYLKAGTGTRGEESTRISAGFLRWVFADVNGPPRVAPPLRRPRKLFRRRRMPKSR